MSAALSPVVIRFGRLGDTVLLQPLLHKLHRRYGQPCRLVAAGAWPLPLYAGCDDVEGIVTFHSQRGPLWLDGRRMQAAWAMRRMREAPFYICEPDQRAQAKVRPMLALARVPADHCVFIEDLPARRDEHWVDWLLRFGDVTPTAFQAEPYAAVAVEAAPSLCASAEERADAAQWMRDKGLHGHPLVLLQPGNKRTMRWNGVRQAADDDKSWPTECWVALAHAVIAQLPEARILLCGSPAEASYMQTIRAASGSGQVIAAAAELPLPRLMGLLEVAHSMVSVDTGPAHLAAALGCPLVVLFGAVSPSQWAPRGRSAVSVLGGPPQRRRADEISAAQVVAAWRELPRRAG